MCVGGLQRRGRAAFTVVHALTASRFLLWIAWSDVIVQTINNERGKLPEKASMERQCFIIFRVFILLYAFLKPVWYFSQMQAEVSKREFNK